MIYRVLKNKFTYLNSFINKIYFINLYFPTLDEKFFANSHIK